MSSGDILTKRDVAELLKVSERTVERWMSDEAIPYAPLPKRGAWSEVRFFRSSGCGSAPSSRSACLMGW
jgi:3'-phosphoadenosine 5'-phosphosulfate sulfotransferase (PAPS reductase)/FAD synthetase